MVPNEFLRTPEYSPELIGPERRFGECKSYEETKFSQSSLAFHRKHVSICSSPTLPSKVFDMKSPRKIHRPLMPATENEPSGDGLTLFIRVQGRSKLSGKTRLRNLDQILNTSTGTPR